MIWLGFDVMAITLSEHFKSITHNTIGSIISTVILAGAAAVLASSRRCVWAY